MPTASPLASYLTANMTAPPESNSPAVPAPPSVNVPPSTTLSTASPGGPSWSIDTGTLTVNGWFG
jgi:hypothetical protein